MKRSMWLPAIGAMLAAAAGGVALAAPCARSAEGCGGYTTPNSQQGKMKSCDAEATAKGLKGDERETFMKSCLSNTPAAPNNSQQERMKACKADAKRQGLTGDTRKSFMKSCLGSS